MSSYIAFGFTGQGKSSFLNKLSGTDFFAVGDGIERKTTQIKFVESENIHVVDTVGVGDIKERDAFYKTFLSKKTSLLSVAPVKFFLVIKFEGKESTTFLPALREFKKIFSSLAFKSLIVVCIQDHKANISVDEFPAVMKETDGYKYLKNMNKYDNKEPFHFLVWDNKDPYTGKYDQMKILQDLLKITEPYEQRDLIHAFNSAEDILDTINEAKVREAKEKEEREREENEAKEKEEKEREKKKEEENVYLSLYGTRYRCSIS